MSLPVQVKTRGHFRKLLGSCLYPPLLLNFSAPDSVNNSIFKGQRKLKLVEPCQGERLIVKEWLVYKLYNLVTPKSFRTRLVNIKLQDPKKGKTTEPFYGILLESEEELANRNGAVVVTKKLNPKDNDTDQFLKMAVFEYLIGNTDWGVQYLQNIKLLAADSMAVPVCVPYDFDHAGIVGAPHAKPAEELEMKSIWERRYRGYCIESLAEFVNIIEFYNNLKTEIYNLYTNCRFLNDKDKKTTIKYLDDFYTTINDTKKWQSDFAYPCNKNGTGNIIIKGLRKD